MNWSQAYGILRIVIPSAVSFAIAKGWITQDAYVQVGTALSAIVAAGGFSATANTTLNLAKTVASTPGVQVVADHTAPVELQEAAANQADPTLKDIVVAPSATSPLQRKFMT